MNRWLALAVLLLSGTPAAQSVNIETVAADLEQPWAMAEMPDGRWLVTETAGRFLILDTTSGDRTPITQGVPAVLHKGQAGLFDVVLDREFAVNRRLFFSYACGTPEANHTCMASAKLAHDQLIDVEEHFRSQPAKSGFAHFGGRLLLLPDNTILLSLGDGFDWREQAQNPSNHLGGVVRVGLDGDIPVDNPLLGVAGAQAALFSYGHRNVQGLVWDERNAAIYQHEHGPRGGDELNRLEPGGNYGWPLASFGVDYTGALITPFTDYPATQAPLWQWTPSIAPSDMALYQGSLFTDWQGDLLITSLAAKSLHRVSVNGDQIRVHPPVLAERRQRLRAVRVASGGSILLLTDGPEAELLRLTPSVD